MLFIFIVTGEAYKSPHWYINSALDAGATRRRLTTYIDINPPNTYVKGK